MKPGEWVPIVEPWSGVAFVARSYNLSDFDEISDVEGGDFEEAKKEARRRNRFEARFVR